MAAAVPDVRSRHTMLKDCLSHAAALQFIKPSITCFSSILDKLCWIHNAILIYPQAMKHKNTGPQNFYGIGGMKIFRDLIWQMQGFMRADHKFFKSHGQYDFPQKQWPKMLAMYLVGLMIASPKVKAKMGNKMTEGMLMTYKKVLNDIS